MGSQSPRKPSLKSEGWLRIVYILLGLILANNQIVNLAPVAELGQLVINK